MKYLVKKKGNIPVVISIPHGGYLRPKSIKNRQEGCFIKDSSLLSLSRLINREFAKRGKLPYYIASRVTRRKIDLNRAKKVAVNGKDGEFIWEDYHQTINLFIKDALSKFNTVLYLDLHGQSTRDFVELGYSRNLKSKDYKVDSFGGFLEANGISSYPSPNIKNIEGRYRSGGFSVKNHDRKNVTAIQVEVDRKFRANNIKMKEFAKKFVDSIIGFTEI